MNEKQKERKKKMQKLAPKMYELLCSVYGNECVSFDDGEEIEKIMEEVGEEDDE